MPNHSNLTTDGVQVTTNIRTHGIHAYRWMVHLLFVWGSVVAFHTAAAQSPAYPLPSVTDLESLTAGELAARMRDIDHSFINVLPSIKEGRMTRRLRDGNRVHEVTAKNVKRWEEEFRRRHYALWQAARAKGFRDISGVYAFRMTPSNCVLQEPPPTRIVIGQQGHSFVVYLSTRSRLSGVIVEDRVDLPLYGGSQPNPFFNGVATERGIRLKNGESCEVDLLKYRELH